MSQSGLIDVESSHPQIPTQIDGDSGSAVPLANVLEVQGLTVANATYAKPQFITASGNTIVVNQQVGKAVTGAPSDKLNSGSVSFDDTTFAVTEHGYVTQISSGVDTATANFIVDPAGTKAEYTTIASAITAASANDVIFVKEGTYSEDLVIDKLLTIVGYTESSRNGPNPVIIQPSSASFLITAEVKFENVYIKTNGFTICTLSTSNTLINFFNCRIGVETAKTGFVNTTGGVSSGFGFRNCHIDGAGTAVLFDAQQGNIGIRRCWIESFTTTSTIASGTCDVNYSKLALPITTSSSGRVLSVYSEFTTPITTAGTGTSEIDYAKFSTGSTTSISVGTGTTVQCYSSVINSSNANVVDGAGTFKYGGLVFSGTSDIIGTTTQTLVRVSHVPQFDIVHTSTEADDHALEIDCNAAGFGDVKALDIDYITGAITSVQDEEAILVNIDETASTGGIMAGYLVLTTSEGSATVNGYETGININPIVHQSGTFGDADSILNKLVDVTAALASGGAGAISIFVADNDTLTIGDAAQWGEQEIILSTGASGSGVAPTFEYSTGGAAFSAFSPADGTNGFRNTGAILWDASALAGWATATSGFYEVRITRTRNSLSTTPIIDELQISALTEYTWNKTGDVTVKSISLTTDLIVADGGSGASTLTGVLTGNGTSAFTANAVTQYGTVVAGASNAVSSVAPSATSGVPLVSQGSSANPVYGTAVVAGGGTGATTFTDEALLRGQVAGAIDPSGVLCDDSDNLTGVTSISFGGTALANYVEGTFTPVLKFGGGVTGITYLVQTGTYTRIGNMVTYAIDLQLSNKGSDTGAVTITGFPLGAVSTTAATYRISAMSFADVPIFRLSGTTMTCEEVTAAGSLSGLAETDFANGTFLQLALTCLV